MKKGLLSILAGALLVVGCQNYDDQFSSLESQINALASTVAGLSQVQSDLASLSGTVSALSGTVASLGSSIDTAVSNGLADITADIAALQAALADVASADDLAAISAAVAANQADLTELLANSSVYTGNVNITSVSTLDTYYAMGSGLAIVNGNVDINATADMDNTKLQAVIDAIKVTTGDFDYQAASSLVAAVSFDNLTGTQSLTVKQSGDYSFKSLGSATNIFLYNTWKNGVKKIDFRELTSVSKFYTNSSTENTINFDKATELHLTKLAFYAPLDLTIVVDEGAAMPFILDDKDIDGDQANITLDITGPAALSISNLTDGSLTFANVASLTVNGFEGSFDIDAGVKSFTADKVTSIAGTSWLSGASDLETLDITGATDPDSSTDVTGPVVTLSSNSNIETVKIAGKTGAISLNGNSSLTDVTISADVNGAISIGTSTGNSALTTVTLTGSKATAVHVENNEDLASLTIDTTFRGASASTTVDGDIDVVNNASLASLTITSTAVENLEVVGNDVLTKVDFSKIATDGTTGTPDVDIYDNDLSATLVDQTDTASDDTDAGEANDLGKVTTTSGLDTVKTYLTHIDGATGADVKISFDTVNFTSELDATTEVTFATNATAAAAYAASTATWIAYITPNTADTGSDAVAAKRSYVVKSYGTSGDELTLYANGVNLGTVSLTGTPNTDASQGLMVNNILSTTVLANADAAGITLTATKNASPVVKVTFSDNDSADENSRTTVANDTNTFAFTASDTFVLSLGGSRSATVTGTSGSAEVDLVNALADKWLAQNPTNLAKLWDIATSTSAITFTGRDSGTSQIGQVLAITATLASGTLSNVGYIIGNELTNTNSTGDNGAKGKAIVITMESDTPGIALSQIGTPGSNHLLTTAGNASVTASGSLTVAELVSTRDIAASDTGLNLPNVDLHVWESRSDVVNPVNTISPATSTADTFNRVGWLG